MKYCIAKNTGDGFITGEDTKRGEISGWAGDVWVVSDNNVEWIQRVNGVEKTYDVAVSIVLAAAQENWDKYNVISDPGNPNRTKEDAIGPRPTQVELPK